MSKDIVDVGGRARIIIESKRARAKAQKDRKLDRSVRRQLKSEGFVPDAVPGISDNDNWLFNVLQESEQTDKMSMSSDNGWLFDVPQKSQQ